MTLTEFLDGVEGDDFREECESICANLREIDSRYDWVGIYWLKKDELVLGPWSGPQETEHKRIPISQGICGAAVREGKTVIVDDVKKDPRYLPCFTSTRSEIVVPIVAKGKIIGEIDIDGKDAGAYKEADRVFLEEAGQPHRQQLAGPVVSEAPLMISVAGVRGIIGESLTAEVALRWAAAFGSLCRPGTVVVGGDSRVSKVMMRAATFAGLSGAGANIIDVGVVSTPTVQLAVEHFHARGGIAITASHNPAEWNALKFFNSDALFLDENEGQRLRALVDERTMPTVPAMEIGAYTKDDGAVKRHVEAVLKIPFLNREGIRKRRFRVGLDAVNGSGGDLLTSLLTELGCEVVGFHVEPTGLFPRNPEPLAEHLSDICAAMKAANVDIGFVVDPDADRLAVILDNGTPAGEELTLVAAADLALRHVKGPVVANCSSSRALDDVAARHGVAVTRTKVGEAHVSRKMKELSAVIGGEGNGGVMLASVHLARDSAVGVALILQTLLEHGGTSSEYFATLPHYAIVKRRKQFRSLGSLADSLEYVEAHSPFGAPNKLDGLKWTTDSAWVQVRASNTEPILRVFAEAKSEAEANRLAQQILNLLNSAG